MVKQYFTYMPTYGHDPHALDS